MIHSMTAFARESATTEQGVLTVELRSVNHRYLDCSFKLPDACVRWSRNCASKPPGRWPEANWTA